MHKLDVIISSISMYGPPNSDFLMKLLRRKTEQQKEVEAPTERSRSSGRSLLRISKTDNFKVEI